MNSLLFHPKELSPEGLLEIDDHRARHILKVLRLGVGAPLRVGEINGLLGKGRVESIGGPSVKLSVKLQQKPPPALNLRVLLALPRPKVLGRKLRSLAELGIKDIHLIGARKVESSYWTAHQLAPTYQRKNLLDGLSLANDTLVPEVQYHKDFWKFSGELSHFAKDSHCFLSHPYGEEALPGGFPSKQKVTLAIGPEGGWTSDEVLCFERAGFKVGRLGQRVLSTETAIVALVTHLTQR